MRNVVACVLGAWRIGGKGVSITFRKVECPERMVALVANDTCQRPLLPVVVPLNAGDICVQRNRVRHTWDLELVLGLASVVA